MPDSLVYFGGAIKAIDENGKVGGYLVRFSDSGKNKDLSGEYFTSKTFLGSRDGDGVDTIFHHGQPLPVKANLTKTAMAELDALRDHVFAPVKTKRDAVGIWAEAVLDLSDEYEKAVYGLAKAGKLGWSSGAVGHLVKKTSDGQITRWPIGEASMTPTPCEPLNRAVAVKSLEGIKFVSVVEGDEEDETSATIPNKPAILSAKLKQHIDDLIDDKGRTHAQITVKMAMEAGLGVGDVNEILEGKQQPTDANLKAFARVLQIDYSVLKSATRRDRAQSIKGMFEDALAEEVPSRWQLDCIYSDVLKKLAAAATAAQMAGIEFDLAAKVKEATDEYAARLNAYAMEEITEYVNGESDSDDGEFYLKAIVDVDASVKSLSTSDLDTHSQFTVSVLRGISNRFRGNHEGRVKAGRVLSEKNRQRIMELMGKMDTVKAEFQSLLDESMPMASEAEKRAAVIKHLAIRQRHRELTMGV